MNTKLQPIIFAFFLVFFWSLTSAEIPRLISYQGKVTESGQPVSDGSYTMRFRIYNDATSGSLRWDSGDQTVQVTGGVFNILLGNSGQPTLDLSFDEDLWILVAFEGDDQSPRQRLASVGYAYMASGIVPGTEVVGSVTSGSNAVFTGENTATSGLYGLVGKTHSNYGAGVRGVSANSGSALSWGVLGEHNSPAGGAGVRGETSADGPYGSPAGISGIAWATTGTTCGGLFESQSTSGRGVYGEATASSGTTYGVYGESNSTSGRGVYGKASATSGETYGLYGQSASSEGYGVYGSADATSGPTFGGVFVCNSPSGWGVYGSASATSGSTYGGRFKSYSTSGTGVGGIADPPSAADAIGVLGECEPGDYYGLGVVAKGQYRAIQARCSTDGSNGGNYYGGYMWGDVSGSVGTVYGVYGRAEGGSSHYGVYYSGGINGSGVMRNTVRTDDGPVALYTQQSTENWFEDFGSGIVSNGSARIALRGDYRKTITSTETYPIKVFVTPTDQLGEWWVDKDSNGFTLMAPEATDGASFDYRIVGKRRDAEDLRLESTPSGYTDTSLYPDDASVPAEYLRERRKSERVQASDFE